jgi:hypothetical protein
MSLPDEHDLAALFEVWEARAHEARERSRSDRVGDVQTAYYYKGVSDTYQQIMGEVKALFDTEAQAAAAPIAYLPVTAQEVGDLLTGAGLYPRALTVHTDHAFTAVFSRLQPLSQEQRLRLLAETTPSIVILDYGKLADTNEPFIDFAFRSLDGDQKG